jgi:DNA-binding FadR family transcriptional regulator
MNTAQRIYRASTSEDDTTARLAERLAHQIEDDIVSSNVPAGGMMGSLRELSEQYAVGRAAVREAVALLERRGLGRLRPGPYGGFIVAQPDAHTIGQELATYFQIGGVSRTQLLDAREAVDPLAADLAASRSRAGPDRALPGPPDHEDGLGWHLQARTALAELSGEPAMGLFVTSLNALTGQFAGGVPSGNWRDGAASRTQGLREAIATGNACAARSEAEALHRDLGPWLIEVDGPAPLPELVTARQEDDRTLAILVARRLAAEIMRSGTTGQRLGSEWDLCERFSVSRATLRQAIRQLQDSGLVECRRGRGNGLVVRDLRGTGSIRLVLAFLISRQMDPEAAGTTLFHLNRFVPALAVVRADPAGRARLEELLERAQQSDPIDRYDLLRLVQCVSQLADSPIIDLFSRCLAAYEARFHPFLAERLPVQMQKEYFDLLRLLLDQTDPGDASRLDWAKQQASEVMLAMSRSRPI